MQEITELRSMEEQYLVLNDVPAEDAFEEEMLLYNAVPGLLTMESGRLNGKKYHRYRIEGMKNLERVMQGRQISGEEFESLFSRIFAIIRGAREYLLREDGFMVSPETIYIKEKTQEVYLCYFPEYHCPLIEQMRALSTWLLSFLDAEDEKAVYNGYAFHVLCHGDGCTFQSISRILEEQPAIAEVSTWSDEAEEEPKPKRKRFAALRRGILFLGSMVFLVSVGALLFFVMR